MGILSSALSEGERSFDVDAATVRRALVLAAADCGFALLDDGGGSAPVRVRAPSDSRSWDGELSIDIAAQGPGRATAVVTASRSGRLIGGSDPATVAAISIARGRLDAALEARVAAAEPEAPSAPDVVNDLTRLVALRDSGAITPEEFAALKARLL